MEKDRFVSDLGKEFYKEHLQEINELKVLPKKIKVNGIAARERIDRIQGVPSDLPKELYEEVSKSKSLPKTNNIEISLMNKVSEQQQKSNIKKPTLEDLLGYYKDRGVVGEERNAILQTLCAINKVSFGVEGYSGSGKTFLVDSLMSLLPENEIYTIGLSSNMAILNDCEKINGKKYIYIPEIQKAMRKKDAPIVEIIKSLTEGKAAERIVTIDAGKTHNYTINAGKTIIYTLAVENDFKKDDETGRRFLRLFTDSSDEHIQRVLSEKAKSRFANKIDEKYIENMKNVKAHITWLINKELSFKDPFSEYMNKHIPMTPKTISYVDHYYNLLNASAKFHLNDRLRKGNTLFLNLEDHFLIHGLYHSEFCNTITELNKTKDCTDLVNEARKDVNWKACFQDGIKKMDEYFPDFAGEWNERQKKDKEGKIELYDPMTMQKTILE